ncbi:MAG: hemerythrin domain-containing protein [Hyphomonadaceae bacterium]
MAFRSPAPPLIDFTRCGWSGGSTAGASIFRNLAQHGDVPPAGRFPVNLSEVACGRDHALRQDRKRLRRQSKQLSETTEAAVETRKKLLKCLEEELKAHTTIEEELLYPAILDGSEDVEDARRWRRGSRSMGRPTPR